MPDLLLPPGEGGRGAADKALDACSRVVAGMAERVGPAVVRVDARGPGWCDSAGSGVVIAGDGLVLTNSHAVGGARRVQLAFAEDGDAEAEVLGDDPDTDLALLRTRLPAGTPAASLGDSKRLRRGYLERCAVVPGERGR